MRWNGILATTIVALLGAASPAAADPFVVNTNADDTGFCATSCSIRQAIVSSGETPGPDTIQIPAGTYELTQGPLQITSAVTITGASARTTAIYAALSSRVFDIASTTASISHLTVSGGVATANAGFHGGNIRAQSATVLLDHMRVMNGSASSGGGIANRNGAMTIQNSLIDHNHADQGGGDGGGILNFGGDGGSAAQLVVRDSTIAFNSARLIGGIIQYDNAQDSTSLESVTLAYNQTGDRGGGGNLAIAGGTGSIRNSILAYAQGLSGPAPNCSGSGQTSAGANVADDATCALTQPNDHANVGSRLYDGLYTDAGETDVIPFYSDSPARDVGGTCSATDQTDTQRPSGPGCDAGAWEFRGITITGGPQGPTRASQPVFTFTGGDPDTTCQLIPRDTDRSQCSSPYNVDVSLPDGDYEFRVYTGSAYVARSFTVDTSATPPAISDQLEFSAESGATFECSLDGAPFAACAPPYSTAGLAPGDHTLAVRSIDLAGNVSAPTSRSFSIAAQQPVQTPVPTAVPTPTPTPTEQPVRNKSVEADIEGTVTYKDKSGKFVPLTDGQVLPNGTEIDAKRGEVTITTSSGEQATFSEGRFKISQTGGLTTATLSEPLDCKAAKRGNALAAAKKPKSRKLWGNGKGKFRTQGSYSAATIRGTKWLVQDTCTTTLTRVAQGVVSVRDTQVNKTVTLRKGKSYVARAKKKK